jgi:hypothetical protein
VEQPADIDTVARLEPVMRALAKAGRQRWRRQLVDVRELEALPAVQELLVAFGSDVNPDPDARRDAIDVAVENAAGRLPAPFSSAALEHFGIANDDVAQDRRFELAATELGMTTARWYDKPVHEPPYAGLKPRDYVIRLVTYALVGIDDPVAHLNAARLTGAVSSTSVGGARVGSVPFARTSPDVTLTDALCIDVAPGDGRDEMLAAQAYRLGVRRSPAGPGFAVPADTSTTRVRLSRYVTRAAFDTPLRDAISAAFDRPGVHVVALQGFSYAGKSRALLEALRNRHQSFRLLAPQSANELLALLNDPPGESGLHAEQPTLLWLDRLERFVEHTGTARWDELLGVHRERSVPIILLTALGGTAGVPIDEATREFLQLEHPLDRLRDLAGSSMLTLIELRAHERGFEAEDAVEDIRRSYDATAKSRPGPWESAARDGGFLRALAHAHSLERRYLHGEPDPANIDPRGQSVAWAVMAWRRAVQSDDPVDVDTIERLSRHSPLGSRGHIGNDAELQAALEWACRPTAEKTSSLIRQVRSTDGRRAFGAEGFLAQALVQSHELTASVWAIVEGAAPADRRAIVRSGGNVTAVQAHGRVSAAESAIDIDLRLSVAVRRPDDTAAQEAMHSAAFRTASGFVGRLQTIDNLVEIVLWSTPVGTVTTTTVAARLAPSAPAADFSPPLPMVLIAQSDDGYWRIPTDLAAPRSKAEWQSLAESVRIAAVSP